MFRIISCLMIACLWPLASIADEDSFQGLLAEANMQFEVPDAFTTTPTKANRLMQYEQALVSPDGQIEARYSIRPLSRIQIDYSDAHSATPEPNHLFPLIFQALIGYLSNSGHNPSNEYPPDQAKSDFGADWASAALMDIKPEFSDRHSQALLLAIHKNDMADAYTIVLFDDYAKQKEAIRAALAALSFNK